MKNIIIVTLLFLSATPTHAVTLRGTANIAPVPPFLSAQIAFSEPSGNNMLDADEAGALVVTVKNSGKGDAYDVTAELASSKNLSGLSFDRRVTIGTVPAGGTVKKEIPLRASEDIVSDNLTFTVELKEANGFDPQPMKLSFKTKAFEPPKLAVVDVGITDQATGGSKVEPGKIVDAVVRVQNLGHGDARSVRAELQLGQNVFVAGDSQTSFDLGGIPTGQFKDIKFSFYTNNRIKNGETIPITVQMVELRPRFNGNKNLALVMNAPQKSAQEFVVAAVETVRKGDIQAVGGLSVDVDQNIPEGQKAGKFDMAVVIGNRNYSASGAPDIDYAGRDAQVMRDYLTRTMGFDAGNIIYAEDATLTKFYEIFGTKDDYKGKLFKWVKLGQSKVFIYYVGHGAPDAETAEAYFVPVDANPQYLKTSGYKLQTFYDNLAKIGADKVTVVIDACFSGATPKGTLFKGTSALVRQEKVAATKPANALLLTSSSGEQFSSWYPEKKHSLFTYFFLKGLGGEADSNKDGVITVGEMRSYLADQVPYMARRLTGNEQTPQVAGVDTEILVRLKK